MEVDRNGLEILDLEECLRLLATTTIGRIALTRRALPIVLPVSYDMRADRIVLCDGPWTASAAAAEGVVAFEADGIDPASHEGWSVAVVGLARRAADATHRDDIVSDRLALWARGGDLVEISTELATGRRTLAS